MCSLFIQASGAGGTTTVKEVVTSKSKKGKPVVVSTKQITTTTPTSAEAVSLASLLSGISESAENRRSLMVSDDGKVLNLHGLCLHVKNAQFSA